jgi:hypothetical protein
VVLTVLALAALYWAKYFKIGVFDQYRAGYAAVSVEPVQAAGSGETDPCDGLARRAFPAMSTLEWNSGQRRPDEVQAFIAGCQMKWQGLPADPWQMHTYFSNPASDD